MAPVDRSPDRRRAGDSYQPRMDRGEQWRDDEERGGARQPWGQRQVQRDHEYDYDRGVGSSSRRPPTSPHQRRPALSPPLGPRGGGRKRGIDSVDGYTAPNDPMDHSMDYYRRQSEEGRRVIARHASRASINGTSSRPNSPERRGADDRELQLLEDFLALMIATMTAMSAQSLRSNHVDRLASFTSAVDSPTVVDARQQLQDAKDAVQHKLHDLWELWITIFRRRDGRPSGMALGGGVTLEALSGRIALLEKGPATVDKGKGAQLITSTSAPRNSLPPATISDIDESAPKKRARVDTATPEPALLARLNAVEALVLEFEGRFNELENWSYQTEGDEQRDRPVASWDELEDARDPLRRLRGPAEVTWDDVEGERDPQRRLRGAAEVSWDDVEDERDPMRRLRGPANDGEQEAPAPIASAALEEMAAGFAELQKTVKDQGDKATENDALVKVLRSRITKAEGQVQVLEEKVKSLQGEREEFRKTREADRQYFEDALQGMRVLIKSECQAQAKAELAKAISALSTRRDSAAPAPPTTAAASSSRPEVPASAATNAAGAGPVETAAGARAGAGANGAAKAAVPATASKPASFAQSGPARQPTAQTTPASSALPPAATAATGPKANPPRVIGSVPRAAPSSAPVGVSASSPAPASAAPAAATVAGKPPTAATAAGQAPPPAKATALPAPAAAIPNIAVKPWPDLASAGRAAAAGTGTANAKPAPPASRPSTVPSTATSAPIPTAKPVRQPLNQAASTAAAPARPSTAASTSVLTEQIKVVPPLASSRSASSTPTPAPAAGKAAPADAEAGTTPRQKITLHVNPSQPSSSTPSSLPARPSVANLSQQPGWSFSQATDRDPTPAPAAKVPSRLLPSSAPTSAVNPLGRAPPTPPPTSTPPPPPSDPPPPSAPPTPASAAKAAAADPDAEMEMDIDSDPIEVDQPSVPIIAPVPTAPAQVNRSANQSFARPTPPHLDLPNRSSSVGPTIPPSRGNAASPAPGSGGIPSRPSSANSIGRVPPTGPSGSRPSTPVLPDSRGPPSRPTTPSIPSAPIPNQPRQSQSSTAPAASGLPARPPALERVASQTVPNRPDASTAQARPTWKTSADVVNPTPAARPEKPAPMLSAGAASSRPSTPTIPLPTHGQSPVMTMITGLDDVPVPRNHYLELQQRIRDFNKLGFTVEQAIPKLPGAGRKTMAKLTLAQRDDLVVKPSSEWAWLVDIPPPPKAKSPPLPAPSPPPAPSQGAAVSAAPLRQASGGASSHTGLAARLSAPPSPASNSARAAPPPSSTPSAVPNPGAASSLASRIGSGKGPLASRMSGASPILPESPVFSTLPARPSPFMSIPAHQSSATTASPARQSSPATGFGFGSLASGPSDAGGAGTAGSAAAALQREADLKWQLKMKQSLRKSPPAAAAAAREEGEVDEDGDVRMRDDAAPSQPAAGSDNGRTAGGESGQAAAGRGDAAPAAPPAAGAARLGLSRLGNAFGWGQ